MPAVLRALTDRKDLQSSDIYLLSTVTALQRVIETLPHFISPYLQDVISQASEASPTPGAPRRRHLSLSFNAVSRLKV